MYIHRAITPFVHKLAENFPVVMITGPRQSGKSTLVQKIFPHHEYISMDDASELEMAKASPGEFISSKSTGIIIDEVQKAPTLLDAIKYEVDKARNPGRVILTGSNQPELLRPPHHCHGISAGTLVPTLFRDRQWLHGIRAWEAPSPHQCHL